MTLPILRKLEIINKIENYGQNKKRDNINSWISWFFKLNSWSGGAWIIWRQKKDYFWTHIPFIQKESYQWTPEKTKNSDEHEKKRQYQPLSLLSSFTNAMYYKQVG